MKFLLLFASLLALPSAGWAGVFLCAQAGDAVATSLDPCAGGKQVATTVHTVSGTVSSPSTDSGGSGTGSEGGTGTSVKANTASPGPSPRFLSQRQLQALTKLGCCRICFAGGACGDTCVAPGTSCNEPFGCACEVR